MLFFGFYRSYIRSVKNQRLDVCRGRAFLSCAMVHPLELCFCSNNSEISITIHFPYRSTSEASQTGEHAFTLPIQMSVASSFLFVEGFRARDMYFCKNHIQLYSFKENTKHMYEYFS
jgi:hypothetical protein